MATNWRHIGLRDRYARAIAGRMTDTESAPPVAADPVSGSGALDGRVVYSRVTRSAHIPRYHLYACGRRESERQRVLEATYQARVPLRACAG